MCDRGMPGFAVTAVVSLRIRDTNTPAHVHGYVHGSRYDLTGGIYSRLGIGGTNICQKGDLRSSVISYHKI